MKNTILLILMSLIIGLCFAQSSDLMIFGEKNTDSYGNRVITANGYIIQTNNFKTQSGIHQSIIRKFTRNLVPIDSLVLSNEDKNIHINDLVFYQDEYLIMIGTKEIIDNSGYYEIMIRKYDLNLHLIEEVLKNMNTGIVSFAYHYLKENGNIVIAASVDGNPPVFHTHDLDFLMMEIDMMNEIIFDSIFDYTPSELVFDIKSIAGTNHSLLLCSPNFQPGSSTKRLNILDEDFNLIEAHSIPDREYNISIEQLNNSNYLINSRKYDDNYVPTAWFAQHRLIDSNFNEIDIQNFGSPDSMMLPAIYNSIATQDSENIYSSYTYNTQFTTYPSAKSYICISSIDENLNSNWIKYFGGDAYYLVYDMCTANEDGCLVTGNRYKNGSTGPFERGIFILKADQNGLITSTAEENIPIKNAIVMPNPGKDYLQLHTGYTPATLQLFNLNGQLLLEEAISNQSTQINTSKLSSGTYIWKLVQANELIESGKWIKE